MYFIKMLRKKYQENYIISKKKKVEELAKDVQEISFLFQELFQEIKKQDEDIKTIEEKTEKSKEQIYNSESMTQDASNEKSNFYILTGSLFGGGLGSLMLLYNPYAAICTCIGGIIGGGFLGSLLHTPQ